MTAFDPLRSLAVSSYWLRSPSGSLYLSIETGTMSGSTMAELLCPDRSFPMTYPERPFANGKSQLESSPALSRTWWTSGGPWITLFTCARIPTVRSPDPISSTSATKAFGGNGLGSEELISARPEDKFGQAISDATGNVAPARNVNA